MREFWDMKRLRWFAPTEELRNEVAEMFTANFKRAQKNHAEGIPRGVMVPFDRHAAESKREPHRSGRSVERLTSPFVSRSMAMASLGLHTPWLMAR